MISRRMLRQQVEGRTVIIVDGLETYESERLERPINVHLENPDARTLIAIGVVLINLGKILWFAGAEEARKVMDEICSKLNDCCREVLG